jgi:hypothetical protein
MLHLSMARAKKSSWTAAKAPLAVVSIMRARTGRWWSQKSSQIGNRQFIHQLPALNG